MLLVMPASLHSTTYIKNGMFRRLKTIGVPTPGSHMTRITTGGVSRQQSTTQTQGLS